MDKIWEILQVNAIEIVKVQELFVDRSGSSEARIEIMAANLLLSIVLLILVVVMTGKKYFDRKKQRSVRKFYGEDIRTRMRKDIIECIFFLLKSIGFIMSFWIMIDITLYRIQYDVMYSSVELVTRGQIKEALIKMICGYVVAYIFVLLVISIRKRISGERTRELDDLKRELVLTCIVLVVTRFLVYTATALIWVLHIMNIYIIWHRLYFTISDWITVKSNNYKNMYKKKGDVK